MYDLLVVGAGPYGLSIASHAATAGLNVHVLGRPMDSWRDHMPRGMFLKSEPWASNLSDPEGRWRLDVFCAFRGMTARHAEPIPLEVFTEYGLWFAHNAVPTVDERTVVRVAPRTGGFEAVTEDGETLSAKTVVLAVGALPFAVVPASLRHLPPTLVSHSSHHADLDQFRDQDVTVIGGGQAALETAALLREQGTRTRVLVREDRLRWNDVPPPCHRPWWRAARSPHSGLGPGWRNWFYSERPDLYRRLPERTRTRIAAEALGPAGAWWVRERVERQVEVLLDREVVTACEVPNGLRLEAAGRRGGTRVWETEHVIAATGFRASGDRLSLLCPELRALLATGTDGAPEVGVEFESSYPGLFLAGLATAASFGPAMRFVHGATFTAGTLVRGVRRRLRTGPADWRIPAGRRGEAAVAVRR
ncbi:dimethylaniline monooxygenase [Streptomyces pluripotens]|uniref:Dimethylaniline monooxygenase n=1 Tax=Streptomyces pluripotens TaxID=1355015 RepID=A0A221NXM8_9ACTN|nr:MULTISPECIES: FAD-dependent oxidoreductase [Streptomyces]ARP70303.1 dimethylaniline monooxygenase [Streptomyces pluripotens]ASN24558.1 dimethylaniline monooxygenase [Streptomyces pluripotens]KIE28078.1 dimethylaniline monooxygenase [Streptomyces sp. MUSC 125]MCH0558405.1 NAD(P)-binding domain-containing protein [Streptomyces sp. MUM 16J]